MAQHAILSWQTHADATGQTVSNEGGIVHRVDALTLLRRFLILGSTGTFYATGFQVTRDATAAVDRALAADARAVLDMVCEVSAGNLALRKDPQLYVLARLTEPAVPLDVRRDAGVAVATVARTGTDLLHWLDYRYGARRASGRLFRRAVANWFLSRTPDDLALQAVKYDQRDGWTLRDALRLARPKAPTPEYARVFDWMAHGDARKAAPDEERLFHGYAALRVLHDPGPDAAAALIEEYRLPREAVPGELLAHRNVWAALFPDMPGRALLRNLGKLGSVGLFDDPAMAARAVEKIGRATTVCHPFEFLIAGAVYRSGRGVRGSLAWTPVAAITDALGEAFGRSLGTLAVHDTIRPLIALDVSGSMSQNAGGTVLSCIEAEVALAQVLAYQFPQAEFVVYSGDLMPVTVHGRGHDALRRDIGRWSRSSRWTRCDLPLRKAATDTTCDAVVSITDSETGGAGNVPALVRIIQSQPSRETFRHAVVAMATNDISIADAADPRQLDLVGLDASMPRALALFLSGEA